MKCTADIFGCDKALIGMVHIGALPGTPHSRLSIAELTRQAVREAELLADAGFDALIIENMHDVPYLQRDVGPEITASMAVIGQAVRNAVSLPLGVQVLAGANRHALAIALAIGAQFIRTEGFVFASVADEGLLSDADAGPLLRYRRAIGAEHLHVLVDVQKKHSAHAITSDVSVTEMCRAAEFFGADGVILTGIATGQAIRLDDLGTARVATQLPLIVGSGVTPESVADLFAYADALIVGSWFKREGHWSHPADHDRACTLVQAVHSARSES